MDLHPHSLQLLTSGVGTARLTGTAGGGGIAFRGKTVGPLRERADHRGLINDESGSGGRSFACTNAQMVQLARWANFAERDRAVRSNARNSTGGTRGSNRSDIRGRHIREWAQGNHRIVSDVCV